MWYSCKQRRHEAALVAAIVFVAGVSAADDGRPVLPDAASPNAVTPDGAAPAPEVEAKVAGAPEHRMRQALIGNRPVFAPFLRPVTRPSGPLPRLDGEETCPMCGRACRAESDPETAEDEADTSLLQKTPFFQRLLASGRAGGEPRQARGAAEGLRPGEPAQVILDLKRRLGRAVYDDTEFGGPPEAMIDWIRTLDEESRREPLVDAGELSDNRLATDQPDVHPDATAAEIGVLRQAARKLSEVADLLEEQNLFDSADEVRAAADALRCEARERVQRSDASLAKPCSTTLEGACQ